MSSLNTYNLLSVQIVITTETANLNVRHQDSSVDFFRSFFDFNFFFDFFRFFDLVYHSDFFIVKMKCYQDYGYSEDKQLLIFLNCFFY